MTNTPLESLGATHERLRKGDVVLEVRSLNENTGQVIRVGHKSKWPTAFHKYSDLGHLSEGQLWAGCRLFELSYYAGRLSGPPIAWVKEFVSNGSVSSGYNPSDRKLDAENELRSILKELSPQEELFITRCIEHGGVGGETERQTLKHIRILSNGLRIAEHLFNGGRK